MRRKLFLPVLILCVGLSPLQTAFAWNARGHKLVATVAYRGLDADTQQRLADLLRHHPAYAGWEAGYDEAAGAPFGLYLFMQASVWPDQIRRDGGPYNHPAWHYVDYPLVPPDFAFQGRPAPEDDALFGLAQSLAIVTDTTAALEARAAHLSWVLHLVGDLHQPLHAAALTNKTYPDGDRGGNDFFVRPSDEPVRLHSLWDGLLGRDDAPRAVLQAAILLEADHARDALEALSQAQDPTAWSLESRRLAMEQVYLSGALQGGAVAEDARPLPEGYLQDARQTAERRIALAAYRLADVLAPLG